MDQYVNRSVSARGPYDLFSSDRTRPISTGHFAAPKFTNLGPGHYEIKSSLDDWSGEHKRYKGRFSKGAQYPHPPAERHYQNVLAQCPKDQHFPGPSVYKPPCPGDWPKVQNYKQPSFNSTAERMDRRALRFLTGNYNSVGVGRYDIRRFEEAQHHNGFQNIFKAKGVWKSYPTETYLRERMRGATIPPAQKSRPVPAEGLPGQQKPRVMYNHQETTAAV
ncbi:hypothetical protein ACOMHN_006309 [Nucella lapillus]